MKQCTTVASFVRKIQNRESRISVFSLGIIGLPTAVMFTKAGFYMMGIDKNEKIVKRAKNFDMTSVAFDQKTCMMQSKELIVR